MNSRDNQQERPNPPAPEPDPGRGALLFTALSVVISFLVIIYGVWIAFGGEVTTRLAAFGFAIAGYGLLNLGVLSCAHQFRAPWCITAIQVLAACLLVIYVLALSVGLRTGFGIGGILLVAWSSGSTGSLSSRQSGEEEKMKFRKLGIISQNEQEAGIYGR